MPKASRASRTAGRIFATVAAITAFTAVSSSAFAQCRENFPGLNLTNQNGVAFPIGLAFPLGTGSSLGALTGTLNSMNTAFLTTNSSFVTGGSGAWVRGVGGVTEVKSSTVGTLSPGTNTQGLALAGSINCNTTVKQEYAGIQVGVDISQQHVGGGRFNWGVTGGRMQAITKDNTPAGNFNNGGTTGVVPAGDLQADQGVPFVGLYATYTQGSFFLDTQLRWDFYQVGATEPAAAAPFSFGGRSVAITANAGYNMPIGKGWFIEPSGGVVWSNTSFDTFFVNRNPALANVGAGNISIDDITSVIGRATLRFGTNIQDGKITWQPYFSYSLFHEFNGDVTVRSVACNQVCTGSAAFNGDGVVLTTRATGGVGTYNQFALGIAGVLSPTTTVYARGDYKIGDNLEGWGISTGLRVNF